MNTAVIYQSKYGFTETYAKWISSALSCDLFQKKTVAIDTLSQYDTIILGGGLYAGGVNGIDLFAKNFKDLQQKNLVLFTCGLADPADQQNINHIRLELKKQFSPRMEEKIKVFHLRGGIDYKRLSILHKAMMGMLYQSMKRKNYNTLRPEDKEMLATYGKAVDFTDKSAILPIIQYVHML